MPDFCAAINCGNSSSRNGDISFFRFPSDVKRCKKWVINTRRAELVDKTPEELRKNYVLCSSHFDHNQFANVLHKRLNWNAVPTVFDVPYPPYPPAKRSWIRNSPLRQKEEIASARHAIKGVDSKDVTSLGLSVQADCNNTCGTTTETGNNVEKATAAPLLNVDQQPSFEIGPGDTPVKKQKTECETTAATTETGSPVVEATAPLLNVNQQPLVPVAVTAPQTPVIRIIKICQPKICQLQPQLNKMNYKKVIFKTAVVTTQPTKLIRPVQAILAAPATYKTMPDITAHGTHPTNSSLRMVCGSPKQTEHQSTAITSTQTTAAIPNVAQRVSVSCAKKPPETPAEKKLKQKIHQLHSQLWRRNRKVEALKRKVSEILPESTRQHNSVEAILEAAKRFLTPMQLSLFRAQLSNSQKEKNGYRWSTSDKIFGLQLLYKSAAAFRFVSQHLALPSEVTLRRFVAETLGSQDSELTTETSIPSEDLETDDNHPE